MAPPDLHKEIFDDAILQHSLKERHLSRDEIVLALYTAAFAEVERAAVPLVGDSTDRRCFGHLHEVFQEDNCSTLMCFICSCKHVCHSGFDKFGRLNRKGNISHRSDVGGLLRDILSSSSHEEA